MKNKEEEEEEEETRKERYTYSTVNSFVVIILDLRFFLVCLFIGLKVQCLGMSLW